MYDLEIRSICCCYEVEEIRTVKIKENIYSHVCKECHEACEVEALEPHIW